MNITPSIIHRQPNTKCLLHLLQRGQYISYIIMYYRSPCLFFRNIVRSTSSCFGAHQDHYGARGLWPDHSMLGDCLDHSPTTALGLRRSFLDLRTGTASTTLRPRLGDFASRLHATGNSHTVEDILSHLDLATGLIPRLPASSGTTSVRCTCRCISYRLYDDWILNLTGNSF